MHGDRRLFLSALAALFVTAVLAVPSAAGGASASPGELTKYERDRARMILKIVRDDLEKFYYDPAFHGVSLDAAFKTANERIDQASSLSQLFAGIARPLLELKDSHTFFIPPERSARIYFGWLMQAVGDECLVTAVQDGSDAKSKGLKPGDAILAVDGFKTTRENAWAIDYVYRILAPKPTFTLSVKSPGTDPRKIEVKARIDPGTKLMRFSDAHEAENEAWLVRHRYAEYGTDLAIWKFPRFDLEAGEVNNDMRKMRDKKALVLDLRGNPGGEVESLERMVGVFIGDQVKIGDVKSREAIKPVVSKKAGDVYAGKLVVLVDSESASAAELFARTMQINKRATIVGDRTGGFVMMSRTYDHLAAENTWFASSITIADIIMPDGKSLEHSGVVPDTPMLPTPDDLLAGRDPVLAHAASLCGVTLSPEDAGALFPIEWKK